LRVYEYLASFVEAVEVRYLALVTGARQRLVQVVERVVGVFNLIEGGVPQHLQDFVWVLFWHGAHDLKLTPIGLRRAT
jgi:hypothetical protein